MTRNLDEDEKGGHNLSSLGGNQVHTIISESGLYNAIFRSRREEAKAFRRWVTATVLPELRRTGSFALAATPPLDSAVPQPLADVDTTRFSVALAAVSLMRKLRGNTAALLLWDHLGLPRPDMIGDGDDDLAQRVAIWTAKRSGFTNDELAAGLGLGLPDYHMRRRFGDILRLIGFERRHVRRGRALAWAWLRAPQGLAS